MLTRLEELSHEITGERLDLNEFARKLRQDATDPEDLIWRCLRDRRVNQRKFRRQHPIEPYILDFYCADAKLAVELDGSQHGHPEGMHRDAEREKFLEENGIATLRFWNSQWRKNQEGCLLEIWNAVQERSGLVRVMKNAEGQRFIPPDLKQVKFPKT